MRKLVPRIMVAAFAVLMCFTVYKRDVDAASVEFEVPVSVTLEGTLPEKAENYIIALQGADTETPMPSESESGIYTMPINGEDTKVLPSITFKKVGIYNYQIWQEAGINTKCTYDDSVYDMTIYVTNNDADDGFVTTVVIYKNSETAKQAEIEFHNIYRTEKPKTGDSANTSLWLMVLMTSLTSIVYIISKNYREGKLK